MGQNHVYKVNVVLAYLFDFLYKQCRPQWREGPFLA